MDVHTGGTKGESLVSSAFMMVPGTKTALVHYQFVTQKFPVFCDTGFNGYFRVSICSKNGSGVVCKSASMNALDKFGFDMNGSTV
jgi:hypothetical protein